MQCFDGTGRTDEAGNSIGNTVKPPTFLGTLAMFCRVEMKKAKKCLLNSSDRALRGFSPAELWPWRVKAGNTWAQFCDFVLSMILSTTTCRHCIAKYRTKSCK